MLPLVTAVTIITLFAYCYPSFFAKKVNAWHTHIHESRCVFKDNHIEASHNEVIKCCEQLLFQGDFTNRSSFFSSLNFKPLPGGWSNALVAPPSSLENAPPKIWAKKVGGRNVLCVLLHNFSSGHTLSIIDSFFCWAIYEKVMGVKRGHFLLSKIDF